MPEVDWSGETRNPFAIAHQQFETAASLMKPLGIDELLARVAHPSNLLYLINEPWIGYRFLSASRIVTPREPGCPVSYS